MLFTSDFPFSYSDAYLQEIVDTYANAPRPPADGRGEDEEIYDYEYDAQLEDISTVLSSRHADILEETELRLEMKPAWLNPDARGWVDGDVELGLQFQSEVFEEFKGVSFNSYSIETQLHRLRFPSDNDILFYMMTDLTPADFHTRGTFSFSALRPHILTPPQQWAPRPVLRLEPALLLGPSPANGARSSPPTRSSPRAPAGAGARLGGRWGEVERESAWEAVGGADGQAEERVLLMRQRSTDVGRVKSAMRKAGYVWSECTHYVFYSEDGYPYTFPHMGSVPGRKRTWPQFSGEHLGCELCVLKPTCFLGGSASDAFKRVAFEETVKRAATAKTEYTPEASSAPTPAGGLLQTSARGGGWWCGECSHVDAAPARALHICHRYHVFDDPAAVGRDETPLRVDGA
ncbi:hypothetical protein HWV62_42906 [Athelia sp. TMB]|nr:hypothetical protein HWV62_42906 [Athelia sp. TMB]